MSRKEMSRKGIECVVCKKIFSVPVKDGSIPKHCSDGCRRESRLITISKYAAKTRLKEKRYCPICGDFFIAEGQGVMAQRYCSDKCARRAENNKRNEQRRIDTPIKNCSHCGKEFRGRKVYCSFECYTESKRPKEQKSFCPICGEEFTQRGCKRKYCSPFCSIKAEEGVYRRNALTRNALRKTNGKVEVINPKEIFERDGWCCQLCGQKVDKSLYKTKGTKRYANAPSLDHIIPLSRGGEHTKINVQCAHYLCNCKKSNKLIGQPRMFG
jgi:5-methylcytosine-specific restriction endonuclease McrA